MKMNTQKHLFLLLLCLIFLMGLPIQSQAQTLQASTAVYLRRGPSQKYSIIKVIPKGGKVTYISTSGSWKKVSYGSQKGYVKALYLKSSTLSASSSSSKSSLGKAGYVSGVNVNIRKSASFNGTIITYAKLGTKLTILKKGSTWSYVRLSSGQKGYIYSIFLTTSKNSAIKLIRAKTIACAKKRIGDIYSQTKRNKKGYADCSSLVRDSYKSITGKFIGDDTSSQHQKLKNYFYKISSLKKAVAGDLIYHFGSSYNHTGIYLGDGYVLHASSTKGKVTISRYSYSNTFWQYGCNAAKYCTEHNK